VPLEGHNQHDYITGAASQSPRQHVFHVSDDGDLTALRYDNRKYVFMEQRAAGTEPEPISEVGARLGWTPVSMADDWETVFAFMTLTTDRRLICDGRGRRRAAADRWPVAGLA